MSTLGRRLTALEEIAEEVRLRPFREAAVKMARAHGLTLAETEETVQLVVTYADERDALLQAGKTPDQVMAIFADRMDMTVAELERRCVEISAHLA